MRHVPFARVAASSLGAWALVSGVSPAQSEAWRVRGVSRMPGLGKSVAFLGDVNGDGVPDFVSGGMAWMTNDRGHVALISGADGSTLLDLDGAPHGRFGAAVANAGDVDADGIDDFAVGAPSDGDGNVYVYSGVSGALLRTYASSATRSQLGASLASLGDLDGDGVADLAVGAPAFTTNGSDLGLAVVYSGATGSVLLQFTGASVHGGFGTVVDDAGDLDLDGLHDLLVVEENDASSGAAVGTVRIFSSASGVVLEQWTLGAHAFDWNAAAAGDVNGDGTIDVVASNTEWPRTLINPFPPIYDVGGTWVIDGATGATLWSNTAYRQALAGVCGAGDVDGDGFGDFAVSGDGVFKVRSGRTGGTLAASGGAEVLHRGVDLTGDGVAEIAVGVPGNWEFGSGSGAAKIFDPVQGTVVVAGHGASRVDFLGQAVALLDDVNGDGKRDVLVGTSEPGWSFGCARILSGSDGSELRVHASAVMNDFYARSVMALPDFDGDGTGEYAIAVSGVPGASQGRIEIRSGASGNLLSTLAPAGGGTGDFGACCAVAIQPSGALEIAVGCPSDPGGGAVHVFDVASGTVVASAIGAGSGDDLGASVAWVGDLDGDGVGDWAAGVPQAQSGPNAYVVVFSGATGSALHTLTASGFTWFGSGICGPGDVDGDGTPDLFVGAEGDGTQSQGAVYLYSGATWNLLRSWPGVTGFDQYLGSSVTAIGDVNRDGVTDVLFGSLGKAQLISGATGALLYRFRSGVTKDWFGYLPAGVAAPGSTGSMNGDSIPDVAIGAYLDGTNGLAAGRLSLYFLDDLYLQISPANANDGDLVSMATSGGPAGNLAGLFFLGMDGTPAFLPVGFGNLDSVGRWTLQGNVPTGLSGHTFSFGSYAIGFAGKVVDSQAMALAIQ